MTVQKPMKTKLPFTYRNHMTIESNDYRRYVNYELNRLDEKQGDEELVTRLQCAKNNRPSAEGDFNINMFASKDGQAIYYNKWKCDEPTDLFICLNGLESHAGWFSKIAREFTGNGITVYAVDRRGSGLNSRNKGIWRDWVNDAVKLTDIAREENPECRIHLLAICFGAKAAAACAIQYPQKFDSMILLSPGFKVKVSPDWKEKIRIALTAVTGFDSTIPSPIKDDKLFTDSKDALYFIYNDKLRTYSPRASDFYQSQLLDSYTRNNLKNIITPSLVMLAGRDQVVDNEKTKKELNHFGRKPVIIHYPGSKHVIFFGQAKEKMMTDIKEFIKVIGNR